MSSGQEPSGFFLIIGPHLSRPRHAMSSLIYYVLSRDKSGYLRLYSVTKPNQPSYTKKYMLVVYRSDVILAYQHISPGRISFDFIQTFFFWLIFYL